MMTLVSTNILAIIALVFLVNLAKRNVVISNKKNRMYTYAAMTTIALLVLEITTIFIEHSQSASLVTLYRIVNILGFSLSPVVTYFLLQLFRDDNKTKKTATFLLMLPLFINAVISILSYELGFIFYVDAQRMYSRGPLFLLPTVVSLLYYILFLIVVIKNSTEYKIEDKKVIISIFLLPVIGIFVQLLFKDIILIWSCTSISLLLFYIFLLDLQFKYDVQTKIKNRASFEEDMQQLNHSNTPVGLVICDINNLKDTNDVYGHKVGDELIFETAKIIKGSFWGMGTPYRIGGDEFCVICKNASEEQIQQALIHLETALIQINQMRRIELSFAYGYALYQKDQNESIYSVMSKADKAMYINKVKSKGLYGRREDDHHGE